ncbi:MAG: hypothetical protein JST35_06620 [Armatimonadetes bacterium]|nr:hypothetical protein [Armatimonadota bacterium]
MKSRASIAVVLAVALLAGCKKGGNVDGLIFTRTDETGARYAFEGQQARFLARLDSALVSVRHGSLEYLFSSSDNPSNSKFLMVFVGNGTDIQQSIVSVPYSDDWMFTNDGQITLKSGGTATSLYSPTAGDVVDNKVKFQAVLTDMLSNPSGISASFRSGVSASMDKVLHEEALKKAQRCMDGYEQGTFCIVVPMSSRVVLPMKEWVNIAAVPVEYGDTTATLRWKQVTYDSRFSGLAMDYAKKTWYGDDVVFRVEDDKKFLVNPENQSRWKVEPTDTTK